MPAVYQYRENREAGQSVQGSPQRDSYVERDSSDASDDTDGDMY